MVNEVEANEQKIDISNPLRVALVSNPFRAFKRVWDDDQWTLCCSLPLGLSLLCSEAPHDHTLSSNQCLGRFLAHDDDTERRRSLRFYFYYTRLGMRSKRTPESSKIPWHIALSRTVPSSTAAIAKRAHQIIDFCALPFSFPLVGNNTHFTAWSWTPLPTERGFPSELGALFELCVLLLLLNAASSTRDPDCFQ